ncbi:MFS transporter [Streptomyces sp. NPDC048518]|uniref:MFS transporter n=1 Tax=Streptomyces sp. NPDC048518 TaxID=3155029 RepID=UPI0033D8CE18
MTRPSVAEPSSRARWTAGYGPDARREAGAGPSGPRETGADRDAPGRQPSGLPTAFAAGAVTVLTSLPVFLPGAASGLISADLGWNAGRTGFLFAVYWLASLLGAFRSRRADNHWSVERVLAVALVLTGAGLLGAGAVPAVGLWLSSLLGGFLYGYTQPHTNVLIVRRCAPRIRAAAMGLKQAAVPAATLLASITVPLLADSAGWRAAFVGSGALCVALGTAFLCRSGSGAPVRPPGGPALRFTAHISALSCAGFFGAMVGNGLGGFLMLSLTERGSSLAAAGAVASAGATLNVGVRLGSGLAADRRPGRVWSLLGTMFLVGLLGTALLASSGGAVAMTGALLAYAGGWGWAGLLHHTAARSFPGQENHATAWTQMGVSLGAAVGPVLCGVLFDVSPSAPWWALTAAGAAAFVCVRGAHRTMPADGR